MENEKQVESSLVVDKGEGECEGEGEAKSALSGAPVENLETPIAKDPYHVDDMPNGGLVAWLQVLGSFILFVNHWGVLNTFGAFQTYYKQNQLSNESESNISWIGSIQAFLLLFAGILAGPVYDAGYMRELICGGAFLVVFGMMMTSISTAYWQVMLAQGICVGLGCAALSVPSMAVVATYFSTRKAIAIGMAASGSSIGGIIYPIVFHKLTPLIGFGWATRVFAFIMLSTLGISLVVMKMRVLPKNKRSLLDLTAFKEPTFVFFSIGSFFGFMGLYVPFFYVQTFAISHNILDEDEAFYMLTILNATSFFGRLFPNYLADKIGPLNVLVPSTLVAALLAFCFIAVKTKAGLIALCVFYGFFSGTFVSVPPTVMVTITKNMGVLGTRMGLAFAIAGMGLLVGNPIAGVIVDQGNFPGAWAFSGAALLLSVFFNSCARIAKTGYKLNVIA